MGEKKKTAHRALYRKYRSKSLSEIKGQEHITKTLANAVKQGQISHAYLFTGPRGVGKTSIARILAHEINELDYKDETPHLDIIEIDAASNRRIDDVRDLREKVHIAPVSAKYKVYIIDEVHMLTSESFNALLKTLEEPPSHVIFILATTEVHKLPATIISRTQRHSFKSADKKTITEHLAHIAKMENIVISPGALELLAQHADGSFRDSISLLDQVSSIEGEVDVPQIEELLGLASSKKIEQIFTALKDNQPSHLLQAVETLIESGVTPSSIAMQVIQAIRLSVEETGTVDPRSVRLMDELVSVGSAQYPKLKLEAILLGALPNKVSTQPAEVTTSQITQKPAALKQQQPQTPQKKTAKPKSSAKTVGQPPKNMDAVTPTDITNEWPDILAAVKAKNNSLYTVLRLAKPILKERQLSLSFAFLFHIKRVEESKNRALIAEAVDEVLKLTVTIETLLEKNLSQPAVETLPPLTDISDSSAHASLISGIQDIMGGGEVVSA